MAIISAAFLTLAGCQSPTARAEGQAEDAQPVTVAALKIDPDQFNLTLTPPKLLRDQQVEIQPLQGDALERASLTFEQVLEELSTPAYIAESQAAAEDAEDAAEDADNDDENADDDGEAADEPPAAAVRAYTLGRLAYHEGERLRAIEKLEEAHQLDPESAHVLRVLGRMYFAFGNEARGAQRLKDAVRLEGDDEESLFLLGRYAAQQGRWEESIATLARSAEVRQAELDPAIRYLRPFYLGQALLETGHLAAAIEQMREYLQLPQRFSSVTRLHRELAFLDRQRGRTHVQVGDALTRLGRLDEALAHYERGMDQDAIADPHLITARRVYVLLAMGHENAAQALLIERLRERSQSRRALELVSYVADNSSSADAFAQRLRSVYRDTNRPAALVMAMADLLDSEDAVALFAEHLEQRPSHVSVFERLLAQLGADRVDEAVATTVDLVRRQPDIADRYTDALLGDRFPADRVLEAVDALAEKDAESAAAWYLRGAAHEKAGRSEDALAAYDRALEADRTFSSPHLANVELQIRLEHYERALELLDAVDADQGDDARLQLARARAYAGLDRTDDAIDVLDDLIAQHPRQAEPRLLLGELQTRQRDFAAARRTLTAVLDFAPANEEAYALLFDIYDENMPTDPSEPLRLLQRAQQEIPDSRITRIRMVTNWYLPRRQFDEAETVLKDLIADDPTDFEALSRLVGLLGHTDRWDEAQDLLVDHTEHIEQDNEGVILLMLLEEVVKHTGDNEVFYAQMESFLDRQQPSAEVYLQLARLYDPQHLDRPEKAIEVLRKAIELEPEFVADLRLYLVQLLQREGRTDEALAELTRAIEERPEAAAELHAVKAAIHHQQDERDKAETELEKALEIEPDHPRANNDLAYYWAEQDRNLEQAMRMAEIAVEAEPRNGAYLDTLGWIYYKLGQFDHAVEQLQAARATPEGSDAVILDHLGDALWRVGREEEAVQLWRSAEREAARLLESQPSRSDLQQVHTSARQKAAAVGGGQRPDVAPVPGEGSDADPEPPDPPDGE